MALALHMTPATSMVAAYALLLSTALRIASSTVCDFESGQTGDWRIVSGAWRVTQEPGNRVLCFQDSARRGRIELTVPRAEDLALAARLKVVKSDASWMRVHFELAGSAGGELLTFALLSHKPTVIRQRQGKPVEITDLGGTPRLSVGRWFRVKLRLAGNWLVCSVSDGAGAPLGNAARVSAEGFQPTKARVSVYHGQGDTVVALDDLSVSTSGREVSRRVVSGSEVAIENTNVRVALQEGSGRLALTDKRTGRIWRQTTATGSVCLVRNLVVEDDAIRCRLETASGRAKAEMRLMEPSDVLVTVSPDEPSRRETIEFPPALVPSSPVDEWILPIGEGVRVRADRVRTQGLLGAHTWSQRSLTMPWFGLGHDEEGLLVIVETPDDFLLGLREATVEVDGRSVPLVCATNQWLPQRDRLGYARRLRYCLFDRGGHVTMARCYRQYLKGSGRFRTLEEKARDLPHARKLVGAIDIVNVSPKGDDVIDWMIDSGIQRALYTVHWHGRPLDRGAASRLDKARRAGYVTSRFAGYFDVYSPELIAARRGAPYAMPYLKAGYPEETVTTPDGLVMKGWAYPVGRDRLPDGSTRVRTVHGARRCTRCMKSWMVKTIPASVERFGYQARFIDVTTANPLWECFSSDHPMTRTQDRETRRGFFEYLASLGLLSGSEGGADWANDLLIWQEGSLTIPRLSSWPRIYPSGKPLTVPERHAQVQFDPRLRVPLRELVYHDSTFITWRWEQTPQRWNDIKLWRLWDLYHILYAQIPIFVIHTGQATTWNDSTRARILRTYRDVCGWTEKVGGVDMVDHRYLTSDRTVQETRFANGWSVVVNFSKDREWQAADRTPLPPLSFRTQLLEETNHE